MAIGTVYATVTQGKSDEPPPGVLDTRSLAEGESYSSWRKRMAAKRRDEVRAGLVDPKVFV